jgi:hypothetical protein
VLLCQDVIPDCSTTLGLQLCADIQILSRDITAVLLCAEIFCAAVAVAVAAAAAVAGCGAAVTDWRKRLSHTLECNGCDSIVILASGACHSHRYVMLFCQRVELRR